jgi:hypothetical protein
VQGLLAELASDFLYAIGLVSHRRLYSHEQVKVWFVSSFWFYIALISAGDWSYHSA